MNDEQLKLTQESRGAFKFLKEISFSDEGPFIDEGAFFERRLHGAFKD